MIRHIAVAGLALMLALAHGAAAQHPLVGLPLDDPAYTQLDGLVQLGCGAARVSAFRPFMVKDIQRALRAAAQERACAGPLLAALSARFLRTAPPPPDSVAEAHRLSFGAALSAQATGLDGGAITPLWRDVRPTSAGDPPLRAIGNLRLSWNGGPNFVAVSEAYAETDRRNDPTVRAGFFRNTNAVIDFDDAYLSGKLGPVVLSAGRAREAWIGAGTESLVLSANGPALDRITLTAQWSRFEFKALVGSINDVVLTPAQDSLPDSVGTQRWHRMLIAHALTFRASPHVELTIGETGLIPRQGGGVDLSYINPVMIYQVTQEDSARATTQAGNTNLTAFGSVRANVGRMAMQGDLLIDDIQIDPKDRAKYPDMLGWNLSASYALPIAMPASLGLQYRRIGSFTYLESYYTDTWQQYNQPVGSELGPDADMARFGADVWPLGRLHLSAGLARWRRGYQRIDMRPLPDRLGHANDPFPSTDAARPTVQLAWLGDLSAEWLDPIVPLSVHILSARIANVNNVLTPAHSYAQVQLGVAYRFRYP